MTDTTRSPILLVPGHWLGAWAWDAVAAELKLLGFEATPLTLPGLDPADDDRARRTLADQVAALTEATAAHARPVTVVAHSGANGPVTMLLDKHPERVARVVWVDSGPAAPGLAFAPDYPDGSDGLDLPEFEQLGAQASMAGLTVETLTRFRARALPQPSGVLREEVQLSSDARYGIPTTFVCCSMPSAQVQQLAAAGHPMFSEVPRYGMATYVDLPTGHWPMWSRPAELASIIAHASQG